MAFVLKTPETFIFENVPVTEPGDGLGTINVEYIYRTKAQYDEWYESIKQKSHIDVVPEFVRSWSDIRDADGAEIPFSLEAVRQIANVSPAFPRDLFAGYLKGLFESRVKN